LLTAAALQAVFELRSLQILVPKGASPFTFGAIPEQLGDLQHLLKLRQGSALLLSHAFWLALPWLV